MFHTHTVENHPHHHEPAPPRRVEEPRKKEQEKKDQEKRPVARPSGESGDSGDERSRGGSREEDTPRIRRRRSRSTTLGLRIDFLV